MEGWLEKRSAWKKQWNVRYFLLSGVTLKYGEKEQVWKEQRVIRSPPIKINEAEFSFVIPSAQEVGGSNGGGGGDVTHAAAAMMSTIVTEDWELRAGNKADFDEWKAALIRAAQLSSAAAAVPAASGAGALVYDQDASAAAANSSNTSAMSNALLSSPQRQQQQQRNRAQSVAVASAVLSSAALQHTAASLAAGTAGSSTSSSSLPPYFVAEKRSQHFHQWRMRIFVIADQNSSSNTVVAAAAVAPSFPPGTLLYSPIDSLTPNADEVSAAMKQPSRLQVISVDVISSTIASSGSGNSVDDGNSTMCRVVVADSGKTAAATVLAMSSSSNSSIGSSSSSSIEEFPLRFSSRQTMLLFVSALWQSLARADSAGGGLLNVAAKINTKCFGNNRDGSSGMVLGAGNNCSVLLKRNQQQSTSVDTILMCGGLNPLGPSSSSPQSVFQQKDADQLLRGAFIQTNAAAFASLDRVVMLRLGGEHPHELVAAQGTSPQGIRSATANIPQIREGAAAAALVMMRGQQKAGCQLLLMHGGSDGQKTIRADMWIASVTAASSVSWAEPKQEGEEHVPALLGHAMVSIIPPEQTSSSSPSSSSSSSSVVVILGGFDNSGRLQTAVHVVDVFAHNQANGEGELRQPHEIVCKKRSSNNNGNNKSYGGDAAEVRLCRGRARHGACVVAGDWLIVAGGVAGSEMESRIVEICPVKNFFMPSNGKRNDEDEDDKNATSVARSANSTSTSFVSAPMPLPSIVPNPSVCEHPTKPEFFILGDLTDVAGLVLYRGILNISSSGSRSRGADEDESETIPSLVFMRIQLSGFAPPARGIQSATACSATAVAVSPFGEQQQQQQQKSQTVNRCFLYIAGGGLDHVRRVLVD